MADRPRYAYESAQESVLLPYYKRFVWGPLLRFIPPSVAPNALTLVSTIACGLSFVLAATLSHSPVAMVVAALLVFTYVSLDNMDGAHARRAGRSSRLGEFLDHWLDTLNNGFVVLGACMAAGLPPAFSLGVLAVATTAFFAVQWELHRTGVFRMGRIADVEGNTAVCLLYLLIAVAGPGLFARHPIEGLPPLSVWLGVGVGAQAIWTFLDAFRRVGTGRLGLLPIVLCFALLLLWAGYGGETTHAHLVIGYFANPVFTSRPVLGRLLGRSTARADWTALTLLGGCVLASLAGLAPPSGGGLAWGVVVVYAAITLQLGLRAVFALRGEAPATACVARDERESARAAS